MEMEKRRFRDTCGTLECMIRFAVIWCIPQPLSRTLSRTSSIVRSLPIAAPCRALAAACPPPAETSLTTPSKSLSTTLLRSAPSANLSRSAWCPSSGGINPDVSTKFATRFATEFPPEADRLRQGDGAEIAYVSPTEKPEEPKKLVRTVWLALLLIAGMSGRVTAGEPTRQALGYAPAPVGNPLKGLVPYAGDKRDRFPHSMEFGYLPLSAVATGENQYDWKALETLLDGIAARGHQAIFRFYLEYPGRTNVIPEYLVAAGLKVHKYTNTNTAPFPPKEIETPDYADERLRKCIRDFIAALGQKYDGDPRIGFITAGLLGTWGEWHTHPRRDLWASKEVQNEVLEAYASAFQKTKILLRYPVAEGDAVYATTSGKPFGYHDDSFAWATLDTGRQNDSWFFMARMNQGGPALLDTWKTYPIGGEIRPEAWGIVFDEKTEVRQIQDFAACVQATHVTWLMDTGMFRARATEPRLSRALEQVRQMGYEFHIAAVTVKQEGPALHVTAEVENRGVAPFYYDWALEYALLAEDGKVEKRWPGAGKLTGLLPGDKPRVWTEKLDLEGVKAGAYHLALRVANPLPNGIPLRFANDSQDQHGSGWLTLLAIEHRGLRP